MKKDMDLVRSILLKIEDEYRSTEIYNLEINGYDMETVAYHCQMLYQEGLITNYSSRYADNQIVFFAVGSLTWEGNDFLDKIRDDSIWGKVKETITQKGLPVVIDTIKTISTVFITAAAEGVANSLLDKNK